MAFSLTLPELHTFHPNELKYIEQTSGLYLLYSSENELLYIGKSVNLKSRIIKHFKGGSNVEDYADEFKEIECYYIYDELEMDLSETFLINTLRPKYNKNKYVINKELKNKNKRGYRKAKKPPFEKETFVHLRKEKGMTLQQIADVLGCTNPSIHKYLSYYEIETEKTIDTMRKHFIDNVINLKTKGFFKIDDVKKINLLNDIFIISFMNTIL
jgi:predicted GIY-YIG superfamily endonuclease